MKRVAFSFLVFSLVLAGCRSAGANTVPSSQIPISAPTNSSPVYVSALCTLMGMDARSEVPAGRPVIVMWGWSAATEAQIQDYIQAGIAAVTFDGKQLKGEQQGGVPFDDTAKVYRAVWMADAGHPTVGLHVITYSLTFNRKIFDGTDYYGPGTKNEKQEDRCEIDVK
jgi:hypothetical protein